MVIIDAGLILCYHSSARLACRRSLARPDRAPRLASPRLAFLSSALGTRQDPYALLSLAFVRAEAQERAGQQVRPVRACACA